MAEIRQTRSFLFADLRDYSRFTERHGDDAAARLLARYRSMVREAIDQFDGAEIRTEGDSFYVVFTSVGSAVKAGLAILDGAQAASADDEEPIRVGIGIHAGETVDGDQGIVSSAVNIAARVCSAAGPGELLVTETVHSLVRGYLQVGFVPIGSKKLKGITERVALYRVASSTATPARRPGPAFRGTLARTWPGRWAAAAAISLAVVAIAFIGGTLVREGLGREGASPSATTTVSNGSLGPVPSSTLTASPSGAVASFPNDAEAALLQRLSIDTTGCVRADEDEVPRVPNFHDPSSRPMSIAASIRCPGGSDRTEPSEMLFHVPTPGREIDSGVGSGDQQIGGQGEVHAAFFALGGRLGIPATGCNGMSAGYGDWELGPTSGKVLCYESSAGPAVVVWSVDDEREPVLARAIARNHNLALLYAWWRDIGRFVIAES